ncbi:MAG: ribonuclease HI [Planctomycetota bacterium]|jgi:ribonuclease HI
MSRERPHVELYTDGACSGNPGPGGWAYILRFKHPARDKVVERSGGERLTTNNRMELKSVIEGLRALDRPYRVDLYSDSQYVINGLKEWLDQWKANGWRRGRNAPVKNLEFWKQLDELRHTHDLKYHWIRGHNDHPENERADHLAVAALQRFSR